ncbi:subtilase family protein [Kordia periserrulae]|uniref:Subtilase family protein n=1 Tax=Kordia periserrulae TaxID=701523 RepID=A0A2T6BS84_9FLAO|nr:S8 family serine peptidase [Kordia periserrulae]PTX58827.1 subtilase family protein [Kordia periserrulae]
MQRIIFLFSIIYFLCFINFSFFRCQESIGIGYLSYYNLYFKDILNDTILGVSYERITSSFIKTKKSDTIIIAVLDTPVDKNHEYLKEHIWVNSDEIPENGIDDDDNGYIDDINGWNFLGNRFGENQIYSNMEFNRIRNKYLSKYSIEDFKKHETGIYKKTSKLLDSMLNDSKEKQQYYTMMFNSCSQAQNVIKKYYKHYDYSINQLDSLKNIHPNDTTIQSALLRFSNFKTYVGIDVISKNYKLYNNYVTILEDENFNERLNIGDNVNDIDDKFYGNNQVNHNINLFVHGTLVSGAIVDFLKPLSNLDKSNLNFQIMPISIANYGDTHDKDIAVAIRYAVDNGAKIINMSFGKTLSMRKDWVFEALQYAEKHDVLVVSSAGNNSSDLTKTNDYYPNDNENNGLEVSSNFLLVGASNHQINEKLVASFSNYGNIDVDIFAPGVDIYTTTVNNSYEFQSGTSMAASVTSSIAALIRFYYPNLTASEVKQIIMESGISLDIMVNKPSTKKEKELVPFSSLSKSGKIVNAYNALLMAEEVSKKKK